MTARTFIDTGTKGRSRGRPGETKSMIRDPRRHPETFDDHGTWSPFNSDGRRRCEWVLGERELVTGLMLSILIAISLIGSIGLTILLLFTVFGSRC